MKNLKLQLWLIGSLVFLLSSCLGDDDKEYDDWNYSNCQIKSFSLSNDSIPLLKNVKFTIDQINGLIFNKDSMPYGTVIDEKVVCKIEYAVPPLNVEVLQAALDDSTYWNGSDSLDFSQYVRFDVFSLDGKASKRYFAQINIHQVVPDSMSWTLRTSELSGEKYQDQKVIAHNGSYLMYVKVQDGYELYQSSNAIDWIKSELKGLTGKTFILPQLVRYEAGFYLPTTEGELYLSVNGTDWGALDDAPEVKAVLGVVYESGQLKRPSALATIVNENGKWHYATMNKELKWQIGNEISTTFPVTGFGHLSHDVMHYQRLMVLAGKDRNNQLSNAAWETMDGLQWILLTDEHVSFFDKREGVALTKYDDAFYFFGGIDGSNKARKDIYRSKSKGVTWELVDTLIVFPESYKARGYSSVHVNDDNFILLFGGKESTTANMFDELWSGRINRLGFKE